MATFNKISFFSVILGVILSLSNATDLEHSGCTLNFYLACDPNANCTDVGETGFECACPTGYTGNGYKKDYANHTGTGCEEELMQCRNDDECHINAECEEDICSCRPGFRGVPSVECYDKDECAEHTADCSVHAKCENYPGGYRCTCDNGYSGNGTTCIFMCFDKTDCNQTSEDCNLTTQLCVCKEGFENKGAGCVNIDECVETSDDCHANATCEDTIGSFTCTCKNGHSGNGVECTRMPINCDDIVKSREPGEGLPDNGYYFIDPDGEGSTFGAIEVKCKMRREFGETILELLNKKFKFRSDRPSVTFNYVQTFEEIKAVMATSGFCYQLMGSKCTNGGETLHLGDYWIGANGEFVYSWGGANGNGSCLCGEFGVCADPGSSCNCNGAYETRFDNGKLLDMEIIPVKGIVKTPTTGAVVTSIGDVHCAPESFDIPKDCSDVKAARTRTKSGHQLIDVDGNGPLSPVYVFCDMATCSHEGVTVISHDTPTEQTPSAPGAFPLSYHVSQAHIEKLIEISGSCTQFAEYTCTNSRILGDNGEMAGYVSNYIEDLPYWPGAENDNMCACGVLSQCANSSAGCNCATKDGVTRKDFGLLMKDLPITKVTLNEISATSIGSYRIGALRCSQSECGIEATCQDYAMKGHTESYAYLIDPDGATRPAYPPNQPPFLVYCQMESVPHHGITRVHHLLEQQISVLTRLTLQYLMASDGQLQALIDRSYECSQTIKYTCKQAPLHVNNQPMIEWVSKDGETLEYLYGDGNEASACLCGREDPSTCLGGGKCNCDIADDQVRTDTWTFTNKNDLPLKEMIVETSGNTSEALVEIGPLICRSILPTCQHLKGYSYNVQTINEFSMTDGPFVIDPDGMGGEAAFLVTCTKTTTTVTTTIVPNTNTTGLPDEGVNKCFTVEYSSPDGAPVTPAQIQGLVIRDRYCGQLLGETCHNAPLTNHSYFSTCGDDEQIGWGGSHGEDTCQCGVAGTCAGGAESNCNCDLVDDQVRDDSGWIVENSRLAVCKVCVSLDPTSTLPAGLTQYRMVEPYVSDLMCNRHPVGTGGSCQGWREQGVTKSGTMMVTLVDTNPVVMFPLYCRLQVNPNVGRAEIFPKEPHQNVPENGTVIIEYYVFEIQYIVKFIQQSQYCTQELIIDCNSSSVSINGQLALFWNTAYGDQSACAGDVCPCDGILGGVVSVQEMLPLTTIELGPAGTGTRDITVGEIKCYDLYRHCHGIKLAGANTNPFGDDMYTIDPDLEGPVEPFSVECDFKTDPDIGITKVPTEKPDDRQVIDKTDPGELIVELNYLGVTSEQINALAQVSLFCIQYIQYTCINSKLINNQPPKQSYITTYGGGEMSSYGIPGHSDMVGCACVATNSCPDGKVCHCDVMDGEMTVDYGFVTNRTNLPITQMNYGGQEVGGSAMFDFSGVYCGPDYFYFPKTCQDVMDLDKLSGEYYIQPSTDVDPFLVYCDMDMIPDIAVTKVKHDRQTLEPVPYDDKITVKYYDANEDQMKALVGASGFCQMGIRYECRRTKLLDGDGFFQWIGSKSTPKEYAAGRYFSKECKCGEDGRCGGSESRAFLLDANRRCNCDANDNVSRADAGMFTHTKDLPVFSLLFSNPGTNSPKGEVVLGEIMCADEVFDVNECENGFSDCHEKATCENLEGSYDCLCKKGWQGRGRPDVLANGRNCYDDDECSNTMNYCPLNAICTNTPGSYECECMDGFLPVNSAKHKCVDINECENGSNNCDENADCYNTHGGFECRCKRNFRGDGTKCTSLAQCAVFGDPHIITYDSLWYSFQGTCEYILSMDNCEAGDGEPSFLVTSNFYRKYPDAAADASWVKSVRLEIEGHVIELQQGNAVLVDGVRVNPTYIRPGKFKIYMFRGRIEVITDSGIELTWDGKDAAEVFVPGDFANKTCGMCGNFNANKQDDMVVGPGCGEETGNVTETVGVFANSWVTPDNGQCTANCSTPEEPECPPERRALAELQCRRIYGQHKVFHHCLVLLEENNEVLKRVFHQICIFDLCRINGDMEQGLCPHAEHLFEVCTTLLGMELETWRTNHFCPPECHENMDYNSCHEGPVLTCYDHLTSTTPAGSSSTGCQEGCFCKEGFITEGDTCVEEDNCGCIRDGDYYLTNDVVTIGDCAATTQCLGNNTWTPAEDIDCHDNATCKIHEGTYGCHCDDEYYGDGVDICIPDPCDPNPCGINETCVHNLALPQHRECRCDVGFLGDCGNCTELNECFTELNTCPRHSTCINTIGSFYCKCLPGFFMTGGLCADTDECMLAFYNGESACGENAKCINKIGTFQCPCCTGFEKDANGSCVASSTATEGEKCCYCHGPKCHIPGKVCGTDHVTYESWKDLEIARCHTSGRKPEFDYYGRCRASCSEVECPRWQVCQTNLVTGKPTCECETCTDEDNIHRTICASNYELYTSLCVLKKTMCLQQAEATIIDNVQVCYDHSGKMGIGPWSEWSNCSVSCGKGTMNRSREGNVSAEFQHKYPLFVEKDCYMDPCQGPCGNYTDCEAVSAECVVVDSEAVCECPNCKNVEEEFVCGYVVEAGVEDGVVQAHLSTWKSPCHLQRNACSRELPHVVYQLASCNEFPLSCQLVPELRTVTGGDSDEYSSAVLVNLPKCGGGCGTVKELCCQPKETETQTITLRNDTLTPPTISHDIEIIKECECRPILP